MLNQELNFYSIDNWEVMNYVCEIEECKERTEGFYCRMHEELIVKKYDLVMCSKCNTVVKVSSTDRNGKISFVENCYNCRRDKQ